MTLCVCVWWGWGGGGVGVWVGGLGGECKLCMLERRNLSVHGVTIGPRDLTTFFFFLLFSIMILCVLNL